MKTVLAIYREQDRAAPYEAALREAGIEPLMTSASSPASLHGVSGLLLTGGSDVNPALYGEARLPETDEPDDERDKLESALIAEALERDLPLLAICRGMQLLNVQQGGTLIQHLPSVTRHQKRTADRSLPVHQVEIVPDTLLASIAGEPAWGVNSRHHQAIARPGAELRVSARDAEDGTIEAVEIPDKRFVLAVQWHPEDQSPSDPNQAKLFLRFADAL